MVNKRQEFINALAEYGRLIEFEVLATASDSLGVSGNLKSLSFNKISLNTIHFSPSETKFIQQLVSQGIKNKVVQPLTTSVFPVSQVADAFKFTVCGATMGRVLVQIREEEKKNTVPTKTTVAALPKLFFTPDKSFVISGESKNRTRFWVGKRILTESFLVFNIINNVNRD